MLNSFFRYKRLAGRRIIRWLVRDISLLRIYKLEISSFKLEFLSLYKLEILSLSKFWFYKLEIWVQISKVWIYKIYTFCIN